MKPALLLIDLQQDFLDPANLQPPATLLVTRAARVLHVCREKQIPIVHIWTTVERENDRRLPHWRKANRWMCVAGTPGHKTPEALRPLPGEHIVHKTGFNAFSSSELDKCLSVLGCDSVILTGLHLHACVRTAAVESLERNLRVMIAEDAVASNDPIHAAATRRWLVDRSVTFAPFDALDYSSSETKASRWAHRSPRDSGEILFEVENATPKEIRVFGKSARAAWTLWRRKPLPARQKFLESIATKLEAASDELAKQIAIDLGKPIRHAREEIQRAAANVRDVIRRAEMLSRPKREAAGLVCHESLGVVGIISAWNNPVAIPLGKIAPALIYGNTVLWKPAPASARITKILLRLFCEANLPPDVLHMVEGDHVTAQSVAADENVDAVTLTGSLAAGHAIQEICARRPVPLQAELSGNNAAIVWDDTNIASAAAQIAWGAFAFAGQRCTANRRAIVSAAKLEEFLREVTAATAKLPWGDPLHPETEIGPVLNAGKRDELERLVANAQSEGAAQRVIRPFSKQAGEAWAKAGAYAQPVIVCCDQPAHILVQEETMAPLLVVQQARDFEHALALSNGVRHGLIASLFSHDKQLQKRFLSESRAGILKLNSATAGVNVTLPFGGWKASGLGPPEHGDSDFHFYTRPQAVYGASDYLDG